MDTELLYKKLKAISDRLMEVEVGIQKLSTPWFTTKETATYLRCSRSKVEDLTNSGLLPYRRLDSRSTRSPRLYHRRDLIAYLVTGRNPNEGKLSVVEKCQVEDLL